MGNSFLLDLELDAVPFITRDETRVTKAVEQIFDASTGIVRVEELYAMENKADLNARKALFFSRYCSVQCCRLVMLRLGVLYFTVSVSLKEGGRGIGEASFEFIGSHEVGQ